MSSTEVFGVIFSKRVSAAFLVFVDSESKGRLVDGCFFVGAGVGVSSASDSSASEGVKCVSRLTCFLGGSVSTEVNKCTSQDIREVPFKALGSTTTPLSS